MMPDPLQPLLYRMSEVADLLSVGQSKVYGLVKAGKLKAVKVDGATRIPRDSLLSYIASLPSVFDEPAADQEVTAAAAR